jgi:hypothetical protein
MRRKAAMFSDLSAIIDKSHRNGEKSVDSLQLTSKMLVMNPDCYSWWNYRREILLHLYGNEADLGLALEAPASEQDKIPFNKGADVRDQELKLTVDAIMKNPKCYAAWSHRQWVVLRFECDYQHEIKLCGDMLNMDQRNFHCWNYRRFIVDTGNLSLTNELEFCTEKIEQNFSNYSAFHHRSVYLRILHDKKPLEKMLPILKVEFSIVENATFTDPYDQSVWWYHRFLVDTFLSCGRPTLTSASTDDGGDTNPNPNPNLKDDDGGDTKEGTVIAVLEEQIALFKSLAEFEPTCKWPLDAVLHLSTMVRVWKDGIHSAVSGGERALLEQLEQMDPLRTQRYRAMLA